MCMSTWLEHLRILPSLCIPSRRTSTSLWENLTLRVQKTYVSEVFFMFKWLLERCWIPVGITDWSISIGLSSVIPTLRNVTVCISPGLHCVNYGNVTLGHVKIHLKVWSILFRISAELLHLMKPVPLIIVVLLWRIWLRLNASITYPV